MSIETILAELDLNNAAVRNNGGGFFNHSLFWNVMSP
jgi:Fe-Mn family superoxide dismutase